MKPIFTLDPSTYQKHVIHGNDRIWQETNCYADVLIELIHAFGHEPIAALPFTLAVDYEGDQWTFFKFAHADVLQLYNLDIQELAIWKPLVEHVVDQVERGNPVLVELDSWFMPDTSGTAYKLAHMKTTVAVNEIDVERRHLGYFHNQGYYHLDGDDFEQIFQLDGLVHPRMLPPYVEFVKPRRERPTPNAKQQIDISLELLKKYLALVPQKNPFDSFKTCFARDMAWLVNEPIEMFHTYSFANLRQYGACFELSATYLAWLHQNGVDGVKDAADALLQIAQQAKAFQFQLARTMARKKPLELNALDNMSQQWAQAMNSLQRFR